MNRANAEHLIQTLEEVAARDAKEDHKHFHMSTWVRHPSNTNCNSEIVCGTVACALGWEATTQYAHEKGLSLTIDGWPTYRIHDGLGYGTVEGFSAGAAYLEVSSYISKVLFDPICYTDGNFDAIKPSHVIERIKYFLNGGIFERDFDYSLNQQARQFLPGSIYD